MDVLLYYFSNILATIAAVLLLKVYICGQSERNGKFATLLISRDLEVLLGVSAVARAYWSFSPPPVWNSDPGWIQAIAMLDTVSAIGLWCVIMKVGSSQKRAVTEIPWYLRWPAVLTFGVGIAIAGQYFVDDQPSEGSWHYAGFMVMFNMALDTLAMMPQMYTIQNAEDGASTETCHFVGLLAFARLLRMLFWGVSLVQQYFYASWANMWPFIVPDVVHTLIMGEYLWLWGKKIQRDSMEMLNEGFEGLMTIV